MNTYLVVYDLGTEPRISYTQLITAIKSLGVVKRAQFSTWLVASFLSEVEIRDRLRNYFDVNDSLLVVRFDAYASYNRDISNAVLINGAWKFMNENQFPRAN